MINYFVPEVNINFIFVSVDKFQKNFGYTLDVFFELSIDIELAQL